MFNDFQQRIFESKYAQEGESWEEACLRVAGHVAQGEDNLEWLARFFQIIYEGVFIPGGRVLANAGTDVENLMNCFVLPIEDSRNSIYEALGNAAEIFAWGGGLGFNFSNLREKGALIRTTGGRSCGPLPFMGQFDSTGDVIHQASRRGAQMGILNIDHPDIEEFILCKAKPNRKFEQAMVAIKDELGLTNADKEIRELGYGLEKEKEFELVETVEKVLVDTQLNHFNLSVGITDNFMKTVQEDGDWNLVSPDTGEIVRTVRAKKLLRMIAESAWQSGDPGVFFIDRANEDNMVPEFGDIQATNPCGEVPLLPNESCCLGSINLLAFWDRDSGRFSFEFFEYAIRTAIRFLDNVQEISKTTVTEINETSKGFRRLGLGVMGFADLLAEMDTDYGSEKAQEFAEYLGWFLSYFAWSESMALAEERGTFEGFDSNLNQEVIYRVLSADFLPEEVRKSKQEKLRVRNIAVTSIAPTGTIALLAGVNSAIEPFYSLYYTRNVTSGIENKAQDTYTEFNPILIRKLKAYGYGDAQIEYITQEVKRTGSIQHLEFIPEQVRVAFKTAHDLDWRDHINIQSAWQRYTSNAVSKTINMPHSATPKEIEEAIVYMWEQGLKGGTIYRDGSKTFQILNNGDSKSSGVSA
jgi:ribonucleoside-diphosphate reductase alpha chain